MTQKTNCISPPGIASYAFVFNPQPSMNAGQEPKYSITVLVDEDEDLSEMKKAVVAAAIKKFGDKARKMIKSGRLQLPFRNGDDDREDDPLYAGKIFFSAKSGTKPGIVDRRKRPIEDPMDFYSGCICRVSVNAYGYDVNGNKGVAFGLNNVQKLDDGDRIAGRRPAADDFDAWGDEDSDLLDDDSDLI